ncbi:MAG: S8 family serine peptidase [Elusimicrobia bacterium]|nr:S8 family serine peptidase [Elusimicrobiota bacterium]
MNLMNRTQKIAKAVLAAFLFAALGTASFAQAPGGKPVESLPPVEGQAKPLPALPPLTIEALKPAAAVTAAPAETPEHVKAAQALQDYGLPPAMYIQDPSTIEEKQAFVVIYSVTKSTPSPIGRILLEALNETPKDKVQKITHKKLYMLFLSALEYGKRSVDPRYQANPSLLAAYKAKIMDVMNAEIPGDTDYVGLGRKGKSLREVLKNREDALKLVVETLDKLPDAEKAKVADKKGFLDKVIKEMDALQLSGNGAVLVPETLVTIVKLIPEKELTAGQWQAVFDSYPMGHSLWADRVDLAWRKGITGKGVTVAIIDTGIDKSHPLVAGAVTDWENLTNHRYIDRNAVDASGKSLFGAPDNRGGHGTHMAGVLHSFAPDAKIMSIKALDEEARDQIPDELQNDLPATMAAIAGSLEKVYNHNRDVAAGTKKGDRIDVVSMSLGVPKSNAHAVGPQTDAISAWVKKLHSQGVVVVVAAGNEGQTNISRPGYIPEAITVGAVDYFKRVAAFSSDGAVAVPEAGKILQKPDVFGYGVGVRSAKYDPAADYSKLVTDQLIAAGNGTSPAAPHVAAVTAMLIQSGRQMGIELGPEQIRTILKESSTATANGNPYAGGMGGVVSASRALDYLQKNLSKFKKKS